MEKLNVDFESVLKEYDQKLAELNRQNVILKVENKALANIVDDLRSKINRYEKTSDPSSEASKKGN